jgi:hypothetical protein
MNRGEELPSSEWLWTKKSGIDVTSYLLAAKLSYLSIFLNNNETS